MIGTMERAIFEKGVTIRTTRLAQKALNKIVAWAKGSPLIQWNEGDATKEVVVNALWLWLDEEVGEAAVLEALVRFVPELERRMKTEPIVENEVIDHRSPKPPPKRKRS